MILPPNSATALHCIQLLVYYSTYPDISLHWFLGKLMEIQGLPKKQMTINLTNTF